MKFNIELKKNDRGCYQATLASLPGCMSTGKTEKETLKRVQREVLCHLGVEFVPHAKTTRGFDYYKSRLRQFMTADMSQERKFAALTTMTGLFLMMATIWGAGLLFG